MAGTAARNGRIMLDTSSAANGSAVVISNKNAYSVDGSVDQIDTTSYGESTKTSVAGLPNNAGDFAGFWDVADTAFYNVWGSSLARKLYLYPDFTNNATHYYFTTAFVSLKMESSVAGAVQFSGTWTGATAGAWVHP